MKKLIIIILIILLNTGCYDNVDLNYLYIIKLINKILKLLGILFLTLFVFIYM